MSFLYDILLQEFGKREITRVNIPDFVLDNLKGKYKLRPYQIEAFQRFILCYTENFGGKPAKPYHLLYNMATGSGKTLIMAGLILFLYEQGYRNFLFFVNSNNIIKKTRDNFLNPETAKFLFSNDIKIKGEEVFIKEIETFSNADEKNINIKFTTIQQLHLDLKNTKENSVTYEDFQNTKFVLIADEAHHLNSSTLKGGTLFGSWEETVLGILKQNTENILLEFTATLDYESGEITKKYQDKVLYRYDLAQFRIEKYSKEINLIRSQYDEKHRIIQALILNLYRQELAHANNINLKPVILFKAKRTIKESEQNKLKFHLLIDELSEQTIEYIKETSAVSIVQKAFNFFNQNDIPNSSIAGRIKANFKEENCISANNDEEATLNQVRLNTLEDINNPIRAVFAVQKLNEGWDVLNLFDIVRLYEGQNTGGSNRTIGSTTLAEAQLIGRGARYFPFALNDDQDLFTRKYDNDINNDLKILEELYYHTQEDSRYISELKKALSETGIYEDEDKFEIKKLILKPDFKKTDFYKTGVVLYNKRIEKTYNNIKSFSDLGVSRKNYVFNLSSGAGAMTGVFSDDADVSTLVETSKSIDVRLDKIPVHIIRYAISKNNFFHFNTLEKYFHHVDSISNFIKNEGYLGGLALTFNGTEFRLDNLTNNDYLKALEGLLQDIEIDIKSNLNEFEGSSFTKEYVHNVFQDKEIKVNKNSERADGQEDLVANEPWYVYNANYGTSEEKEFVALFAREFEKLNRKFKDIYLIRNERELKVINRRGQAFEPDFLLFCKQREEDKLIYQVFIEPKGAHLIAHEKWKEDFLKEIRDASKIIKVQSENYLITAIPFYHHHDENDFVKTFEETLKIR